MRRKEKERKGKRKTNSHVTDLDESMINRIMGSAPPEFFMLVLLMMPFTAEAEDVA
jgi:hypothetical protein